MCLHGSRLRAGSAASLSEWQGGGVAGCCGLRGRVSHLTPDPVPHNVALTLPVYRGAVEAKSMYAITALLAVFVAVTHGYALFAWKRGAQGRVVCGFLSDVERGGGDRAGSAGTVLAGAIRRRHGAMGAAGGRDGTACARSEREFRRARQHDAGRGRSTE